MTWVLLLVVCTSLSDLSTCDDRVLAHKLSESECPAMAKPLAARGQIVDCVRETHDVIEDPEKAKAEMPK